MSKSLLHLHIIAHDIRSRENVGSIFRTCEFLGVKKLWLTGYTPAPPDAKLSKVALGSESVLPWEKNIDVSAVLRRLKQEEYHILGLELDDQAQDLASYQPSSGQIVLLLGNEVTGIPASLRELCDELVMIKKSGTKESLNVSVATGIACWALLS